MPRYINEIRIAHACRMLVETDITIKQVAVSCGYRTPAHFQRQFRLRQHRTPQECRRATRTRP